MAKDGEVNQLPFENDDEHFLSCNGEFYNAQINDEENLGSKNKTFAM